MNPRTIHNKVSRFSLVALVSMFALALGVSAGSLTPPGVVGSTPDGLAIEDSRLPIRFINGGRSMHSLFLLS